MNTRVTAVVGLQYGNEEKETVSSFLSEDADIIIKGVNGIHNESAMDTTFRGLPSGALNPDSMNIFGPGCIIDFKSIYDAMENLRKEKGLDVDNIFIDYRACIWLPFYRTMTDVVVAKAKGLTLRTGDILEDDVLKSKISFIAKHSDEKIDEGTLLATIKSYRREFADFIIDTVPVVRDSVEDRGKVVIEGEGGTLRDTHHGIATPEMFSTTLGVIADGSGVSAHDVAKVVGVAKCYTSIVGDDRFPTATEERISAIFSENENHRRARTGWIDVTALDYSCYINSVDELALTRIDALDRFDKVRLCTGYMIEGEYYSYLPERQKAQKAQPIYETMDGWMTDTYGLDRYEDLPEEARAFLERIAEATGRKLSYVTTGPGKENVIKL